MHIVDKFYIHGKWVQPVEGATQADIIDPATEAVAGRLAMGTAADVDRAVSAAREAFPAWSVSTRETRIALLERIIAAYQVRVADLAQAVRQEIGAPITLATNLQAAIGLAQLQATLQALRDFAFESPRGKSHVLREAIGVAALITPWNWPLNQIAAKVAPALAAGCTVVLKPSEIAPLDAQIFAEIMDAAGTPPGVFNMIFGEGRVVGSALSSHRDVDMVSITGSTRAGVEVAISAAPTVKRVAQELGGKSPLIVLDDADLQAAVTSGVAQCMVNSGQTCVAPTRVLVPRARYEEAVQVAAAAANAVKVGDPSDPETRMGPISNRGQYDKVQRLIGVGIEEGARLAAGGLGRPDGLARGFYARPTVFADVRNDMTIAREEIFGPVLCLLPYDSEDDAVAIANDTDFGLAAYIASSDPARARRLAARLRAGNVRINGAMMDITAPFGGYKTSGNGREYGPEGIAEFLETKTVTG
ncbi:aldehyde dehydrogenase family protein [Cupriavidus taiwanensis]|uniref:NAD+-dependent betaine aldehyde dehydrogenase similar to E.coli betB n=1 Tax=Cupriavidus taiwanensis TaxID=164546 RepID=A0A7Z7NPK5_9BURK|nr:aldehyde dehydrogenase family protein [Cupriavidus taiwanensis]SOZ10684.1 NAD+-dependent betaine aldehyde dehydrogenase; similar to E.coli betB [Cupriavidus taiwanensis]SOZ12866.1 NAD+-dependent betaine aldehyde dehydrogenase; similar to E.coli betB [Cupriavidus taiwanensis]SOZ41361.1 NAD+-dependent betaine aldehyde dehydrogenase; similar to E.coli betB [Cupriavidus taiwanensis]SPC23708.1 NAD+-dependent betaine aldehyde dehydrogenase; similar to E.coli betB [Cupriavidus taiwanensis]SPD54916